MLDIHAGEKELPLPLEKEFDDCLVFRRAVKTLTGHDISMDAPITYGMMARWIRRIGEILGFEYATIPYSLRYAAANGFDQMVLDVSEALRNLALDHANSVPFQRHYLGREVNADTWAILRGQKPQQALIKQACSVGHSISKRRPTDLTAEQTASINTHPLIRKLELELRRMNRGSNKRAKALRKLENEKLRLKRSLKQNIRNEWTDSQAVEDIERQLRGEWNPKPNDPLIKDLVREFYTSGDTAKHFRRRHLSILEDHHMIYCQVCDETLEHKKHLQNHGLKRHGLKTWC
ncbi:hypothetical protein V2G26_007043 [Clonostachys chloroleuca]